MSTTNPKQVESFIPMDASTTELRCPECNKLLAKANLTPGSKVEIMCPRWKAHENKEIKLMRFCQA